MDQFLPENWVQFREEPEFRGSLAEDAWLRDTEEDKWKTGTIWNLGYRNGKTTTSFFPSPARCLQWKQLVRFFQLLVIFDISINFLFWNSFTFTEELQRWYRGFLYTRTQFSFLLASYIALVHVSQLRKKHWHVIIDLASHFTRISLVFPSCPFPVPGSPPGTTCLVTRLRLAMIVSRFSLFLTTLSLRSIIGQVSSRMSLHLGLPDVFLLGRMGYRFFWKEDHRSEMPFSSHGVTGACCQHNITVYVDFDLWAWG